MWQPSHDRTRLSAPTDPGNQKQPSLSFLLNIPDDDDRYQTLSSRASHSSSRLVRESVNASSSTAIILPPCSWAVSRIRLCILPSGSVVGSLWLPCPPNRSLSPSPTLDRHVLLHTTSRSSSSLFACLGLSVISKKFAILYMTFSPNMFIYS